MRFLIVVILLLFAGAAAFWLVSSPASPSGKDGGTVVAKQKQLILYCGAGIRPAANALIKAFQDKHPEIRIAATYAGSGRLLGQLAASRRGDLFMPGSSFYVDKAVEDGLAFGETRRKVAYFVPVIFVQKGNPFGVKALSDFADKKVRVGLGDERAVAIGRRSVKIFEKNNIPFEKVRENIKFKSGTVNELGVAVQMKNVDAVIIWDANARQFEKSGDTIVIPPEKNIVSTIPIVTLKFTSFREEAGMFIEFATSEEGIEILKLHKYTVSVL